MVSVYFIGGLILGNLGVIGVYLARTFDETKGRPLYLVAKTTPALQTSSKRKVEAHEVAEAQKDH
jgi:dolichol-phosphate mannosyltransferase